MKVIYVVLVCLLAFTSCAETEYAENGVDKKNITGYTEVGFYSLDGICTFTAAEGDGHPAELGIAGRADAGHHDGAAVKGERRAAERDALAGEGDAVIALDGDALRQIHAAAGAVVEKLDNVAALRGLHRIIQRLILDVADLGEVLRLRRRLNRSGGGLRRCLAVLNGGSSLRLAVGKRRRHERQKHDERHHERQKLSAIEFLHFLSPPFQIRKIASFATWWQYFKLFMYLSRLHLDYSTLE